MKASIMGEGGLFDPEDGGTIKACFQFYYSK